MSGLATHQTANFRLGLVVNPYAGVGGPAGLKGSDRIDTLEIAVNRGVKPKANQRVAEMLAALLPILSNIHIVTASGSMGETVCRDHHVPSLSVVYDTPNNTSASDTQQAAKRIVQENVDLLVFVGGDGTARDIFSVVGTKQTVLGLPAGVKMHSAVFAVTPKAVASVIDSMINHRLVAARMAEVRDIDEAAFSKGQVKTRYFGEMQIPDDQLLVQSVKCSGLLDDEIMLDELSAYILETLEDETLYILGSGGTLKHLKQGMGITEPTLLGVDVWFNGELILADAHEQQLLSLVDHYKRVRIVLSVIGGQGVVLGRGNQQISAALIEKVGVDSLQFISTQTKLLALEGRALTVDSGSDVLNKQLAGFHKIICGYEDFVLYEIAYF
ncbi:MAG: ATP-NAD kinase family protein [Oleiphilus sp.]